MSSPSNAAYRKKLIEVALPLEAINAAAAKEKSIRHGHPSTLHLWWARRPLAACRAVLFGQFVDDPSSVPEEFPTEEAQEAERQRLFRIIEDMVPWANSNDETIFHRARVEIARSIWRDLDETTRATVDQAFTKAFGGEPARSAEQLTRDQVIQFLQTHAPPVLDPFAGGGSIPLEAQRLGLRAIASDLNPVAVLINKALIEIPPKFAGKPPVNPEARRQKHLAAGGWKGAQGLANDVRYYGEWMRGEAWKRIGHLYPQVDPPPEQGGGKATVIAWLWARTVKCPNPACGATMPLVRSFQLSNKNGKESWAHPVVNGKNVTFEVRTDKAPKADGTVGRGGATCVVCDETVDLKHVRAEGKARRLGAQLMAVVAEGDRARVYVSPQPNQEPKISADLTARVDTAKRSTLGGETPAKLTGGTCYGYGLTTWGDLFTPRQLVALTTFSDLVGEAIARARGDARAAGLPDDDTPLEAGGTGARAYAEAVGVYLGLVVSRFTDRNNTICTWDSGPAGTRSSTGGSARTASVRNAFSRQALPMTWDFAEASVFSESGGGYASAMKWVIAVVSNLSATSPASATQRDATREPFPEGVAISTDPPYYDNIGYADLSDFFYVWLKRSLSSTTPSLFAGLLVPKETELVASAYRFDGGRDEASRFFEEGFRDVFARLQPVSVKSVPMIVYYAFKQAERKSASEGVASTGWETMLTGLIAGGYEITGTWPLRTEMASKVSGQGANMLASSIALCCRPRAEGRAISRQEFIRTLRQVLPEALAVMQEGSVAPVDFAQAAIGPGMGLFSKHSQIVEADGSPMTVRTALALINQELDSFLTSDDVHADADTRFAAAWYEQHRFEKGVYGDAETLARAKNTAVQGVIEAGILRSSAGKAQLIPTADLPEDWDPTADHRPTIWEATHHLIRQLEAHGEEGAARLYAKLGSMADPARSLAYRLYSICERKGWTEEARAYNSLILSWPDIARLARGEGKRNVGIEDYGGGSDEADE